MKLKYDFLNMFFLFGSFLLFASCSSDEPIASKNYPEPSKAEVSTENTETINNESSNVDTMVQPVDDPFSNGGDITGALASNRSGDCTTYANSYYSNVTDFVSGRSFSGEVTISVYGTKCVFTTNGIPNHDMGEGGNFATPISAQNISYEVPATPVLAGSPTTNIWKASVVLLNGGTVDILAAACYGQGGDNLGAEKVGCGPNLIDHPWRYDAMSPLNNFGTDIHNAHVQPDGMYHYHAEPNAIFEPDCNTVTDASPVIGFAADGFPVYGSCINDNGTIRSVTSSYQLKNGGGPRQAVNGYDTPTGGTGTVASSNYDGQFRGDWEYAAGLGDLDQCNGMTINGQYGYYVTPTYPWVLACYSGTPDPSFNPASSGPPPR